MILRIGCAAVALAALMMCALGTQSHSSAQAQALGKSRGQGIDPTVAAAQSDILRRQGELAATAQAERAATAEAELATRQAIATDQQAMRIAQATQAAIATQETQATATAVRETFNMTSTATVEARQATSTAIVRTGQATATAAARAVEREEQHREALFWLRMLLYLAAGVAGLAVALYLIEIIRKLRNERRPAPVTYTAVIEPDSRPMTDEEKEAALKETLDKSQVIVEEGDAESVAQVMETLRDFGIRPGE